MQNKKTTKLYVITGFLGAVKTTLLLKLLEHLKGVGLVLSKMNLANWGLTALS